MQGHNGAENLHFLPQTQTAMRRAIGTQTN